MSPKQIDITHMQCSLFRMAQTKWNKTPKEVSALFQKYNILGFISDCYDSLHLSSYQLALEDIETLLHNKGVNV